MRKTMHRHDLGLVVLLALLFAGPAGCRLTHPLIRPEVREDLRQTLPLEPQKRVIETPQKLTEVPQEPPSEVVERAKQITSPDAELPAVKLDLAQVRQKALEYNLDLQVQLFDPSISEAGYQGERWKFEAVLGADVSHTNAKDGQGASAETTTLSPSVRIPTRAGGVVSVALPFSRRDSDQVVSVTPRIEEGRTDTVNLDFGLSQPLLRGAGFDINYASINTAGLRLRQADARTKLFAIRVLANAEQFYWRHYAAHENLKIQLRQYELALEQLRTAQRLVEEGARTKIEITRAQSDVARRFGRIITAEISRRQTELALKRVMNAPDLAIESKTVILPVTPPTPLGLRFDREKVVELALQNRMELFQNEVQLALDRIALKVNRNFVLPDVRLNFTYSFSGQSSELDQALDLLFKKEFDTYTVSLTLELPLAGNQQARYRAVQSALTLAQTETNRQALAIAIRQDVLNAINAVELNWQRILANRLAVVRAQETYEDNKLQFQLGEITATELLLTLDQLAETQSALVFSFSDFQNSLVDLAFATGTTLGRGGVVWTPATRLGG